MSIAPERALQTDTHITEQQRKRLRKLWDGLLSVTREPVGAVHVDDWEGEYPERVVFGATRSVAGHEAVVETSGVQSAYGTVKERRVTVSGCDQNQVGLTAWQARDMAQLLTAAADQLDAWAGR
jgi:hypothetical protein